MAATMKIATNAVKHHDRPMGGFLMSAIQNRPTHFSIRDNRMNANAENALSKVPEVTLIQRGCARFDVP